MFIICLGFYVTPAVLGGGKVTMVSNQIANDIELFFNWGAASALGVVLLVLTLLFLYVASRVLRLEHTCVRRRAPNEPTCPASPALRGAERCGRQRVAIGRRAARRGPADAT